jgi:hypothetical protein
MSTKVSGVLLSQSTAVTPASTDNSTAVATTAWSLLGFATSLTSNGYIKFPTWLGGLTVQWGNTGILPDSTPTTVTFPTAFANQCFIVVGSVHNNVNPSPRTFQSASITASNYSAEILGSGASANWVAVGY